MNIGKRIFYDQDGDIIFELGEMKGDVLPRKEVQNVSYIDLEYGSIDFSRWYIKQIDVNTKQPNLEEIVLEKTPEQLRIEELENELLLASGVI